MTKTIKEYIIKFIKGFYIKLIFVTCFCILYKPTIDKLSIIINEFKRKKDILYKAMCKIKEIINIDNGLSSEHLFQIKEELNKINEVILNMSTNTENSNVYTEIRYQ
jgi:hypothetical protein